MSRVTYTGVTDYLNMPLRRVRQIRDAIFNVLEREKEARENK